jgi:RNA polymerase subunit RPABC4/transcription elongation factor Spt4
MAKCPQCGYLNREGNRHCVNCGSVLELTEEYVKSEKAKQTTATKNYFAYFFIFMGFCTLFGGLMTYATSVGTIIQGMTAQVATPYILIGCVLMAIGVGILMIKTEA